MFSGTQISLYPITDDFVDVILGAISALDAYKATSRIETDDMSTLLVGPPDQLFSVMRDCSSERSDTRMRGVFAATVSRGCAGEPSDPICTPVGGIALREPIATRIAAAGAQVEAATHTNRRIAAQLSLYPLGNGHHMDEIYGCGTDFRDSERSILRFGAPEAHVALDFERDLAGDTRDVDRVVHDGANTATECRKSTGLQRGHHLSLSLMQEIPECR